MQTSSLSSYAQEVTNPVYCLTEVLNSVTKRIAEVEARLLTLKNAAVGLSWDSIEERCNHIEQRAAWGELLGLAHAQGALEGRIGTTKIWLS